MWLLITQLLTVTNALLANCFREELAKEETLKRGLT